MTAALIGDREKLADAQQRIRDALVALADWLTDREDYDIPHDVLRALCPADVPDAVRNGCFESLLHAVAQRGADRTDLSFDGQVDLDYMTGARR
jgi:hypothetical protein